MIALLLVIGSAWLLWRSRRSLRHAARSTLGTVLAVVRLLFVVAGVVVGGGGGLALAALVGASPESALSSAGVAALILGAAAFHRPRAWRPGGEGAPPTAAVELPLIAPARRQRLAAVEARLATAAALDPLDLALADWLDYCRRRVPDLVAATERVIAATPVDRRAEVRAQLADDLDRIAAEGERRLDHTDAAVRVHLATLRVHAGNRVRGD